MLSGMRCDMGRGEGLELEGGLGSVWRRRVVGPATGVSGVPALLCRRTGEGRDEPAVSITGLGDAGTVESGRPDTRWLERRGMSGGRMLVRLAPGAVETWTPAS